MGTGGPGTEFVLPDAPLVDGTGAVVGVQVAERRQLGSGEAVVVEGTPFRVCREVGVFADAEPGEAGRTGSTAPAAPDLRLVRQGAEDPAPVAVRLPGMQVRAWYRSGGGERGNVAAGRLTVRATPSAVSRSPTPTPPRAAGTANH